MNKDTKSIQKVAQELKLSIKEIDFRGEYAPRYQVALSVDQEGQPVVLKLLTSKHVLDLKSFLTEEKFLRHAEMSSISRFVPRLFSSQTAVFPYWYLREHVGGHISGRITHTFGFEKEFLGSVQPSTLSDFLSNLWWFGDITLVQRDLPVSREGGFVASIGWSLADNRKFLGDQLVERSREFLLKERGVIEWSGFFLSHNDLYPANILFQDRQIKVIDWERCGFFYPLSDAAFLRLLAWQDPNWQASFRVAVLKTFHDFGKANFKRDLSHVSMTYWQVATLFWAARLLSHALLMSKNLNRAQEKIRRKLANDLADYLKEQIEVILTT